MLLPTRTENQVERTIPSCQEDWLSQLRDIDRRANWEEDLPCEYAQAMVQEIEHLCYLPDEQDIPSQQQGIKHATYGEELTPEQCQKIRKVILNVMQEPPDVFSTETNQLYHQSCEKT